MEIDKDIPMPETRHRGISKALRLLKIGESIFIKGKTAGDVGGFISNAGLSGKVTRRTIDGGCRIWRIK